MLPNGSATKVTASVTISREVQHVSLTQPLRRCGNAPLGLFTARSSGNHERRQSRQKGLTMASEQYHAHEDAMHQFMIDLGKGQYPHLTEMGGSVLDAINIWRLGIQDEPIEVIRDTLAHRD